MLFAMVWLLLLFIGTNFSCLKEEVVDKNIIKRQQLIPESAIVQP